MKTPCMEAPDMWTSEEASDREWAAQRCAPCHRITDCLEEALDNGEKHGVYGGRDLTLTQGGRKVAEATACQHCGTEIRQERTGVRRLYCTESCGYLARRAKRAAA